MSDSYLSVVQSQFHEWMDYLGVPASSSASFYALAGIAGVAVAAHLFLNSIPGETDLQMISNIDYGKVSVETADGRVSALCLDGEWVFVCGARAKARARASSFVIRINTCSRLFARSFPMPPPPNARR